jgi:transposase-like protein
MITSKDGYCPICKEGDVKPTGFLENIYFFKCNLCEEHYKFNVKEIDINQLPFTKPIDT